MLFLRLAARQVIRLLAAAAVIGGALLAPPSAQAAFPGANGKIAFDRNYPAEDVFTVNPDGTGESNITNSPGSDIKARWRADGQKIAFWSNRSGSSNVDIYVMNANGSDPTNVTGSSSVSEFDPTWSPDGMKIAFSEFTAAPIGEIAVVNFDGTGHTFLTTDGTSIKSEPAWSPDGQKIAFVVEAFSHYDPECECNVYGPGDIFTMNADGTGQTNITNTPGIRDASPDWSPNGQKIVFSRSLNSANINVMNADGSGRTPLTTDPGSEWAPAWSPDGTKIAFNVLGPTIYVMNADGSGRAFLTNGENADWQPLATASYAHPQSAPSLQASLVPTFRPCGTQGNRTDGQHSPPLNIQSCLPPMATSSVARVGGSSQGTASFTVVPGDTDATNGDQADISLAASLSDVKTPAGADYTPNPSGPDLTEITRLRLTDKANNYGGASGTATEYDFRVPIECSGTADPALGSSCSANTSADALLPGFVTEQRNTVVQAFRVRVDDAGANGTTGDSDDRIFAAQGIYVP